MTLWKTLIYLNVILLLIALFALVCLTGCETPAETLEVKHPVVVAYDKQVNAARADYAQRKQKIMQTYAYILTIERNNTKSSQQLVTERDDLIDKARDERDKRIRQAWQMMRDKRLNLSPKQSPTIK